MTDIDWKSRAERSEAEAAAMRAMLIQIHAMRLADDEGVCECGECSQCLSREALKLTASNSLLAEYKAALASGEWPGYSRKTLPLSVPRWAVNAMEAQAENDDSEPEENDPLAMPF